MLEQVAQTASYVTPWDKLGPSLFSRLAPNAAFYRRVASIVFRSAEFGRHGHFTAAVWGEYSSKTREAFERGGTPIIVENLEVFKSFPEPCVIIGNHMSTAETFLPAGFFYGLRPITYVVKRALIEYPVFKYIMRSCDPVVVGREDPRQDLKTVLEEGEDRLRRGLSLIIFPQRTRTVKFNPAEFNSIGVKLARRAGVPVVPFAVKTDAWENGKKLKDFGPFSREKPVHMAFGEPMKVEGGGKAQNDAVVAFIQSSLARWAEWDAAWQAAK
jgi:1-acyl-sn-glycerol-3-phosphate acyltransferase